jgi:hypothetical protein
MPAIGHKPIARRNFLAGAAAAGALALPGSAWAAADPAGDPVRRLLTLASQDAFTRLSAPNGFLLSRAARFGLPVLFKRGADPASPLNSNQFREALQIRLNQLAEAGIRGATPAVHAAIQELTVSNPVPILRGAPTAATSLLRLETGAALANAIIRPLEAAMVAAQDPTIGQAIAALPGVSLNDVAHAVALAADNGIWYEIGASEVAIRANPEATNDTALVAALRGA